MHIMYFDSVYPCSLPSNSSDIHSQNHVLFLSSPSSFPPCLLPSLLPHCAYSCYLSMGVRSCVQEPYSWRKFILSFSSVIYCQQLLSYRWDFVGPSLIEVTNLLDLTLCRDLVHVSIAAVSSCTQWPWCVQKIIFPQITTTAGSYHLLTFLSTMILALR